MNNQKLELEIVKLNSKSAFENLAFEEYLIDFINENKIILFFYQNKDSVVLGRHQNPWSECDPEYLRKKNIKLARRVSGGGTVFHDLKNLNYSIIGPRGVLDREINLSLILKSLQNLGMDIQKNDRWDLLLNAKKISGSAFHFKKKRFIQHGTLLISSDLKRLSETLKPKTLKIETKAIQSTRSSVININDIYPQVNMEEIKNEIIKVYESFLKVTGSINTYSKLPEDIHYKQLLEKYKSWEWIFGNTPIFELIVNQNNRDIKIKIKKGLIVENDSLDNSMLHHPFHSLLEKGFVKII
jgi:lipoate-protein ligase A